MSKESKKKKTNISIEKNQANENYNIETLYVHFDTKEHFITLEDFISTVSSIDIIAQNFSENLLLSKGKIKVYIYPPERGSFLLEIGLFVGSIIASAVISEEVKGFIKGISDYKLGNGGENMGKLITGFLSKTSDEIKRIESILPPKYNIDEALKAKADLYSVLSKNKEIKGIGFSNEGKFPIKRSDFINRMVTPTTKFLPVKEELRELIIVKSVNTDENLQWDFKDVNTKESFSANIEDEDFNLKVLNGQCPLKKKATPDIILALVEFRKKMENGKERKDAYIVKEVYKFNNKRLKTRPKDLRLNKPKKPNNGQLSLFANKED